MVRVKSAGSKRIFFFSRVNQGLHPSKVVLMDTPRTNGDRVPFGDLTNTPDGGNQTQPGSLGWEPNEQKSQREREQYATMQGEGTINKKRHHIDHDSNMDAHSIDGNATNEMDENSDWLHRQSTYNISGPINRLVTCPKECKRDLDRARNAAMSPEQRALLNKRRRESYASKKTAKMLEMSPKETALSIDGLVPSSIGVPGDIDDGLIETDINIVHEMGIPFIDGGFVFNCII